MKRKIYRSGTDKVVAGVCGGLGEYFGIDPVIIRIAWIVITLLGGAGILAYIIAWIIIPQESGEGVSVARKVSKGCLYAVLVFFLLLVAIPVIRFVLGMIYSGFRGGIPAWHGILNFHTATGLAQLIFLVGSIVAIAAIVVIIQFLRKSGKKDDE